MQCSMYVHLHEIVDGLVQMLTNFLFACSIRKDSVLKSFTLIVDLFLIVILSIFCFIYFEAML